LEIFTPGPKRLIQLNTPREVVGSKQNPAGDGFGDLRHYYAKVANAGVPPGTRNLFDAFKDCRTESYGASSAENWLERCAQATVTFS
jgi:hypothetical protein